MIAILIISFTYLFFLFWLISGFSRFNFIESDSKAKEFITIVIAVKNESKNIKKLLKSLSNQSYPTKKYEIIICNDKSTDDTLKIMNAYKDKIKNLKIISINKTPSGWTNKKWALNKAINQSNGEIILQTDGDCIPEEKWIEKMILPFQDKANGFVMGYTPIIKEKNNLMSKLLVFENMVQDAFNMFCVSNNLTISCVGRSIAYRKKYFINVNGYENIKSIISGDDDLLMHKIINFNKCKIKYVISRGSYVYSCAPKSIKEFINQRLRFASKGKLYYDLFFISSELKLILPFLYLVNLSIIFALLIFINNPSFFNFLPFLIKTFSEGVLLSVFCTTFRFKWDTISFLLLSIFHPFYIIIFSTVAPFKRVIWK